MPQAQNPQSPDGGGANPPNPKPNPTTIQNPTYQGEQNRRPSRKTKARIIGYGDKTLYEVFDEWYRNNWLNLHEIAKILTFTIASGNTLYRIDIEPYEIHFVKLTRLDENTYELVLVTRRGVEIVIQADRDNEKIFIDAGI